MEFPEEFELEPEEEFGADPSLTDSYTAAGEEYEIPPIERDEEVGRPAFQPVYQQQFTVPDMVKQFIVYLHKNLMQQRSLHEVQNMYEQSFNKLSEKYFKQSPWPPAQYVQSLINDPLFLILYKELYFRHIYSKMIPTLEQRFDSWKNYCDLFNYLLNPSPDFTLELPNQWLWDMIDEFIYQFQSFCQYRAKLKNKGAEELSSLKNNPQIWNTNSIINYLQSLVVKSGIIQFLEKEKQGIQDEGDKHRSNNILYRMVGYFSLVGLLRVYVLLGDYYFALKTIAPIQLNTKGLLTKVTACHISFFYYMGFSYMMMRRYSDAIKSYSNILLYITRIKQYHNRSYQHDQILKKNEQMFGLLSICLSLCPQRVDENIHSVLKDKYSEKMQKMQKGEIAAFEELFAYSCPKFITASAPNYGGVLEDPIKYPPVNYNQEAAQLQTKLFLNEVKQQALLTTIRSYLKLYTTIGISKLATFLEMSEKDLRTQLLCYKHKTRNIHWTGGSPLAGEYNSSSDVDFFIDKDMIHIRDAKVQRKYSEFFIRHINKFEQIMNDISEKA